MEELSGDQLRQLRDLARLKPEAHGPTSDTPLDRLARVALMAVVFLIEEELKERPRP